MTALTSHKVLRAGDWTKASDRVRLDYEERFLRRRRLTSETGESFLADLPETVSLDDGDAFLLSDGRVIEVSAAAETLLEITGPDLARLAWHIGNRHTPCQIEADRLLIRRDPVLADMLLGLGAALREVAEPFMAEGGAYGHGRTMGHDHGDQHHHHSQAHGHVHHHGSHRHDDDDDADEPGPDE